MKAAIHVTTTPMTNGDLIQKVETDFNGQRELIFQQVIQTQEKQIRDGLIALGWTPPEEKP